MVDVVVEGVVVVVEVLVELVVISVVEVMLGRDVVSASVVISISGSVVATCKTSKCSLHDPVFFLSQGEYTKVNHLSYYVDVELFDKKVAVASRL